MFKIRIIMLMLFTLAASLVSLSPVVAQNNKLDLSISEKLLGKSWSVAASPDFRHAAYWQYDAKGKEVMYQDGKAVSQGYDSIGAPKFSPDSQHLAFVGELSGKKFVVLDGTAGKRYDSIDTGGFPMGSPGLLFSDNSQRLAYAAKDGGKFKFVLDNLEGPEVDGTLLTAQWAFSPDSSHFAYGAVRGKSQFVVVDGKEGNGYDAVGSWSFFSPDSRHVLYWAKRGDKWIAIKDGVEGPEYDRPAPFAAFRFSPNGGHFAYLAGKASRSVIVKDDRELTHPESVYDLVWSPDSSKMAYVLEGDVGASLAIDGKIKEGIWERISDIRFSPDSQHVAYVGTKRRQQSVVVDGQAGPVFDAVEMVQFKPDSAGVVYIAKKGEIYSVVNDSQVGSGFDEINGGSLVVSPNSKRIAYFARTGKVWKAVVDGDLGKDYEGVFYKSLSFSPDSKHVVYFVKEGKQNVVIVDGERGPIYQKFADTSYGGGLFGSNGFSARPVFDAPDRFHAIGIRNMEIYWFEVKIMP